MKPVLLAGLAALYCGALAAGPAPWYKWHSPEADYEVCAQFSPGQGWFIARGPFEDSRCRKAARK